MSERVKVSKDGAVAYVQLSRPEKRNGLDLPMFEGLVGAGLQLAVDPSIRAVVLHGEGKGFCAGLDFQAFLSSQEVAQKLLDRSGASPANLAQRVAWVWQEVPVPVIAAIHGMAFGGGLQIALGADLRYATPDAQLSVMEIKWGLIPDMSITQTLTKLVPLDVAKELTFTGRIVSGSEALELGLVTKVVDDPLAAASDTAKLIASKSPHAMRLAKKMFNESQSLDAAQSFELETALQLKLLGSPNQMEAVRANMERREARFQDPE